MNAIPAGSSLMADLYRDRCRELIDANATLVAITKRQRMLIERQADRIDLLEALLAPPGPRAMARLRRSAWPVRLARRLGWVA